nr:hypothetical protein [Oceanococcus sp. HetDA_MAG_MS8]
MNRIEFPEVIWPSEFSSARFSGEAEVLYLDALGLRSIERMGEIYSEALEVYTGESPGGDVVITQISNRFTEHSGPERMGSVTCEDPFDVVGATWGDEAYFRDITNAEGVGFQSGDLSTTAASASLSLNSDNSGAYFGSLNEYSATVISHPEGMDVLASGGVREFPAGPGQYQFDISQGGADAGWFVAAYGMDQSVNLREIQLDDSPFEEVCMNEVCGYIPRGQSDQDRRGKQAFSWIRN